MEKVADPTCPWSGWRPANLTFCEEDRCAWVTQPANTWSNVGFLIVGLVILRTARDAAWRGAWWFAPIAIVNAFTSSMLHGTGTFMGQAVDLIGMFLESALFVTLNVRRVHPQMSKSTLIAIYVAILSVSSTILLRFEASGVTLFTLHVVVFAAIEVYLLFRDRGTDYRPLAWVVGLFVVSYGLWWLDTLRIVCDPHNHIFTLHSVWHLLGAVSFYFWFRFFAQFDRPGRP
jgi:hypothetical protein